ncbi:unnamed protein product [Prunus armeniaca]
MSQDDVTRHEGAEGNTKLACGKARGCQRQHKACLSQGNMTRHDGAGGNTKLACCKAMWLGTGVPKATQGLRVARQCD